MSRRERGLLPATLLAVGATLVPLTNLMINRSGSAWGGPLGLPVSGSSVTRGWQISIAMAFGVIGAIVVAGLAANCRPRGNDQPLLFTRPGHLDTAGWSAAKLAVVLVALPLCLVRYRVATNGLSISNPVGVILVTWAPPLLAVLGFSVIRVGQFKWKTDLLPLFLAISLIVTAGLSYGFNRAMVLVPLAATYSTIRLQGWAPSRLLKVFLATLMIATALVLSVARQADSNGVGAPPSATGVFEIYSAAPQFVGYAVETLDGSYPGSAVIASAASPIPIVGQQFRQSSGTRLFNDLIDRDDQLLYLQAELFLLGGIHTVIAFFFLLHLLLLRFERRIRKCHPLVSFTLVLGGIWVALAPVSSLLSISQGLFSFSIPAWIFARTLTAFSDRSAALQPAAVQDDAVGTYRMELVE